MKLTGIVSGGMIIAALAVSGCAPRISSTDFEAGAGAASANPGAWALQSVQVDIPESMKVNTNGDVRYPDSSELVWWGDPPGDRKAQVAALLEDAVRAGALDALTGQRGVTFKVNVNQFHAMTPRARATDLQLGVHEMQFDFSVVDAQSGEVLASEPGVNADLRAFSGSQALLAEQAGQGQKIRIQTRVAQVVRSWLSN